MPLSPEAKAANQEHSLTAWIETHLRTAAGLTVFYAMQPIATRPDEWVHVDYLLGMRRDFGRQVDRTQHGSWVHGTVQLSVCKKRTSITNLTNMAGLRDKVLAAFQIGQSIPLQDYAAVGTPTIGIFAVTNVTENLVDDGLESGVMVLVLSIEVSYMEAYTYA